MELCNYGNWARHAPPPGVSTALNVLVCSIQAAHLEDFRMGLHANWHFKVEYCEEVTTNDMPSDDLSSKFPADDEHTEAAIRIQCCIRGYLTRISRKGMTSICRAQCDTAADIERDPLKGISEPGDFIPRTWSTYETQGKSSWS